MNFCLRGALRAPLKQKFIPEISNALCPVGIIFVLYGIDLSSGVPYALIENLS
jgi:hypothetical protein